MHSIFRLNRLYFLPLIVVINILFSSGAMAQDQYTFCEVRDVGLKTYKIDTGTGMMAVKKAYPNDSFGPVNSVPRLYTYMQLYGWQIESADLKSNYFIFKKRKLK